MREFTKYLLTVLKQQSDFNICQRQWNIYLFPILGYLHYFTESNPNQVCAIIRTFKMLRTLTSGHHGAHQAKITSLLGLG